MKKNIIVVLFLLVNISIAANALETHGKVFSELASSGLNLQGINQDNRFQLNSLKYLMRGSMVFKNEFNENANGTLKLEAQYRPAQYISTDNEKIYIKELYIDLLNPVFNTRIGKQYLKWGDGVFFNPTDIVNAGRDPLRSLDEAEGNPVVQVIAPLNNISTLELVAIVRPGEVRSASAIPLVSKLNFNLDKFGGFGLVAIQRSQKPVYGADLNFVQTLGDEMDCSLYAEGLLRYEGRTPVYDDLGNLTMENDNKVTSYLLGTRFNIKFPYAKRFDSLMMILEYYHNDDNWSNADLNNFYKKNYTALDPSSFQYYKLFSNSKDYLFSSLSVERVILNDLRFDMGFLLNIDDKSTLMYPGFSYSYNDNTSLTARYTLFSGKKDTEFGSSYFRNEISLSSEVAF